MRGYEDINSVTISIANNGFIVEKHGTREMQEDEMKKGFNVFESLDGVLEYIKGNYKKREK